MNNELKLPPLALQLLVENVIKHNVINTECPMTILFDYEEQSGRLVVINEIREKANVVTTGVGLKNLSLRYRLICNQDIVTENDANYFIVKIPLIGE